MNRIEHKNNTVFYQFESLSSVTHGIFTRLGGSSVGPYDSLNVGSTVGDDPQSVRANRDTIAQTLHVEESATRTTWQVHGVDWVVVDSQTSRMDPPPRADAIITQSAGVPLAMRFADCVPLVLYDPEYQVLALAHAGWRGTVANIGPVVVQAMADHFGSRPENVIAGVGPSIGPCHYEVGWEVIDELKKSFEDTEGLVRMDESSENPHLDLWATNERALRSAGLTHVEVAGICTVCNRHEFFSHRAEKGLTGRFGVLAYLPEN